MRRPSRRILSRVSMGAWLLVLWLLLWGRFDAATVAGGIVVIALAWGVTRLPALPVVTRVHPIALAAAVLEVAADLLVSSLVIGWHSIRDPHRVKGAIFEVEARTQSEFVLLAVTASIALRPGSIVLDVDPRRPALLIHALPVRDREDAEERRRSVLGTERRLMRALEPSDGGDPSAPVPRDSAGEPGPPETRDTRGEEGR